MMNKEFDKSMASVRGSLKLEGLELDDDFIEHYRKYYIGEITWEKFKPIYPHMGEEKSGDL